MICMFQQYQVDYEDAQVFMCKFSLVLTHWSAVVNINPRGRHIKPCGAEIRRSEGKTQHVVVLLWDHRVIILIL